MQNSGRNLSIFGLFALGFGAIVGVGWSVSLNNMISAGGGPLPAALGFVAAMILLIPVALCYAELAPLFPIAGGAMLYAFKAYGKTAGFIAGWLLALSYITILPWETIAITEVLACVFPGIKESLVLYTLAGTEIYLSSVIAGMVMTAIIVMVNMRGSGAVAKFQMIMTAVLIAVMLSCIILAVIKAEPKNLLPVYAHVEGKTHTGFMSGVVCVFAFAPFYFVGFDTIPQSIENAGVKPRMIGIIMVCALMSAALMYVMIILSGGLAFPWKELIHFDRPVLSSVLREIYGGAVGEVFFWFSLLGTLAGLFTVSNSFFLAASKLFNGMGRVRLLPAVFAKKDKKTGFPTVGGALCGMLMIAGPLLGAGVVDSLTVLTSTGCVSVWIITCICILALRKTMRNAERPYRLRSVKTVACAGIISGVFMLINCVVPWMPGFVGKTGMIMLLSWILLGGVLYAINIKNMNSISAKEREELMFFNIEDSKRKTKK